MITGFEIFIFSMFFLVRIYWFLRLFPLSKVTLSSLMVAVTPHTRHAYLLRLTPAVACMVFSRQSSFHPQSGQKPVKIAPFVLASSWLDLELRIAAMAARTVTTPIFRDPAGNSHPARKTIVIGFPAGRLSSHR
jgi:hypothetical protein